MLGILTTTAISAALPVGFEILKDFGKAIIGRFIQKDDRPKATNVDEYIKLMNAETARANAVASLDAIPEGAGEKLWPWVINMRAGSRYLIAWLVVTATLAVLVAIAMLGKAVDERILVMLGEMVASVWGFLFGERIRVSWVAGKK